METEVVIIRAGPTGLMAACQLTRFGINYIITDSKSAPTDQSRAIIVTARSLEIYQQMGLSNEVLQQGRIMNRLSILINGKDVADVAVSEGGKGLTDFPYMLAFEQSANEHLLYGTLKKQNQEVLWNTKFESLEQNKSNISVILKDTLQQEVVVKAKYLIACDGAASTVRNFLKCPFKGGTYKNKFFVADVRLSWEQPYDKVIVVPARGSFCAFLPLSGDRNYRILGVLPKSFAESEGISFQHVEAEIRSVLKISLKIEQVNWFSVYRLHHRCVENFRVDRCFLAGDAAHIHSPAGGQGMNTGLQDAYNLAWKMGMVLRGQAEEKLLDTYHIERYPFAMWLLKFTDRIFQLASSDNTMISWLRVRLIPFVFRLMDGIKGITGSFVFKRFSQIWYGYQTSPLSIQDTSEKLKLKAGDRFPYVIVESNGMLQSCYQLMKEAKFHLVILSPALPHSSDETLSAFVLKHLIILVKQISLPISPKWHKFGITKNTFILVRQDNYIAMISDKLNREGLSFYFEQL